jgi:hypothetical protein
VLPVEISLNAVRFARQNDLTIGDYYNSMMDNIDEVTDKRVTDLGEIEKDKIMVAKAYNKKVKAKSFQVGDLVWKKQRPKVWEMVAKMGGSIQSKTGNIW